MARGKSGTVAPDPKKATGAEMSTARTEKEEIARKKQEFVARFNDKLSLVELYKSDSSKVVKNEDLDALWNEYTSFIAEKKASNKESIKKAGPKKELAKIYEESNTELKAFEKSNEVKKFKEGKDNSKNIGTANARIKGLITDTDGEIGAAEEFISDYDKRYDEYKDSGESYSYPDIAIVDKVEESGKNINKNVALLEKKTTNKSSKSFVASADVKQSYKDKKTEFTDKEKRYKGYRNSIATKITDIEAYKKGNEEIQNKGNVFSKKVNEAAKEKEEFDTEAVKIDNNEVLTKSKNTQYKKMKHLIKGAAKEKSTVDEINDKINAGKIKVSTKVLEKWKSDVEKNKTLQKELEKNSDTKKRYSRMKKQKEKVIDKTDPKKAFDKISPLVDALNSSLLLKIDNYNKSTHKIALEADARKKMGLVTDIKRTNEEFEEMISLIQDNKNFDADKYKSTREKYSAFLETRESKKLCYKTVKKYVGKEPSRKMIMKLIRRVKLIETSGGAVAKSEYDNWAGTILGGLETVEGIPKKLAGKALSAVGMKSENKQDITMDLTSTVVDESLEGAGDTLDFIDDMKSARGNGQDSSGIWDVDVSNSEGRFNLAMNIIGVAKSGYALFKDVLQAVKEFKGGVDFREGSKRILSLAESTLDLFDSATGFFNDEFKVFNVSDVPLLGTIKSGIAILLKIIDFVRSSKSRLQLNARQKTMREKMRGDAAYQLETKDTKEAAQKSGYDTRGWGAITSPLKKLFGFGPSNEAIIHQSRVREEQSYADKFGSAGVEKDDTLATRKARYQSGDAESKRDAVTGSMHSRMHQLRKNANGDLSKLTGDDKEEYERLQRIERTHEYDILQEADVRMKNKSLDDISDIIKEGWSIASGFMKMTASPAAVAAVATDIAMKIAEVTHTVGSKINRIARDASDNMYSTQNKGTRRSKMAANLYDRMVVATEVLDGNGEFDLWKNDDWLVEEAGEHLETLDFDLTSGLDAYLSHIIECNSKDAMIEQMSSAFSVEGN